MRSRASDDPAGAGILRRRPLSDEQRAQDDAEAVVVVGAPCGCVRENNSRRRDRLPKCCCVLLVADNGALRHPQPFLRVGEMQFRSRRKEKKTALVKIETGSGNTVGKRTRERGLIQAAADFKGWLAARSRLLP